MFDANLFKRRLKEARLNAGLTQGDFAKKLNIARANASYYETTTNNSLPNVALFYEMAKVLNVSYEYLMGEAECTTPNREEIYNKIGISEISQIKLENYVEFAKKFNENISKEEALNTLNKIIQHKDFIWLLYDISIYERLQNRIKAKEFTLENESEIYKSLNETVRFFDEGKIILTKADAKEYEIIRMQKKLAKIVEDITLNENNDDVYSLEPLPGGTIINDSSPQSKNDAIESTNNKEGAIDGDN